jgi:hypothetical protein
MKTKVTEEGVLIPKALLDNVEEVEIREEHGIILVVPVPSVDPILYLGTEPVACEVTDASENHDHHLYGMAR